MRESSDKSHRECTPLGTIQFKASVREAFSNIIMGSRKWGFGAVKFDSLWIGNAVSWRFK